MFKVGSVVQAKLQEVEAILQGSRSCCSWYPNPGTIHGAEEPVPRLQGPMQDLQVPVQAILRASMYPQCLQRAGVCGLAADKGSGLAVRRASILLASHFVTKATS